MNFTAILLPFFSIIALVSIGSNSLNEKYFEVYGQPTNNDTAVTNSPSGSQFIVNIRGISSFTEENMAALISTEDDIQAQKVDLTKAVIEPGQENSFSPSKIIDVTIVMNKQVEPNT